MKYIEVNTRYITSDYENIEGKGGRHDNDAHEGAAKATHSVLKFLQQLASNKKYLGKYHVFNKDEVLTKVEPEIAVISKKFWQDFDHDNRMKLAQVKEEVSKLISALSSAVSALQDRPPYVRAALNIEAERLFSSNPRSESDIFGSALQANQDLLLTCADIASRTRENPGEAVRFRNACLSLAQLWEDMLGQKLPKTRTYSLGPIDPLTGVPSAFNSPAAQFAYIAIYQIGRGKGYVTPAHVEAGIKALPKRGKTVPPTE